MSEFSCPVVRIENVVRHPNADTLCIVQIHGETAIFKEGTFKEGDLAIYVPEDAVVPTAVQDTEWLGDKRRIRAKRLRGVFSCGILLPVIPCPTAYMTSIPQWKVGDDVSTYYGIKKYEEPEPIHFQGDAERDPQYMPKYNIESHRKYGDRFVPGERVIVTEKLHGTNFRALWRDDRLYVGSHGQIRKEGPTVYWRAAKQHRLAELLQKRDGIAIYGEVFGQVQDLKYDVQKGEIKLAIFDAYDTIQRKWLDWDDVKQLACDLELQVVPLVKDGPYDPLEIPLLAEGKSLIASHNREGVVIKPAHERWDMEMGTRTITKYVSDWYRLRKNGTESH